MEQTTLDSQVREAVSALQQYLSDSLPPLVVADSIAFLLRYPPQLMALEIQAWTGAQYRRAGPAAPVSDYLFHALKKIHLVGEFKLVSKELLETYLKSLSELILEYCPEEDRELLRANLDRLGQADTVLASPVEILHRQVGSGQSLASRTRAAGDRAAQAAGDGLSEEDNLSRRRFALLLERLEQQAAAASPGELLPQILAAAAGGSKTGIQLERYLDHLRGLGVEARTDQIFQALGRSLPGWVLPDSGRAPGGAPELLGSLEAMRRIITLSEDPSEGGKRFHEMVQAAIQQFNEGSLAPAVTMLDLADRVLEEKRVDSAVVDAVRRKGNASLDPERLRDLAGSPEKHPLLRKVLNFFFALRPPGLLDSLEAEKRRDRREAILALLQVHGGEARAAALERLELSFTGRVAEGDWHFQGSLLELLRRIRQPAGAPREEEVDLLARLTEPGYALPLVKEAFSSLGQIPHEKTEKLLVSRIEQYEGMLLRPGEARYEAAEVQQLLDRAASALARLGTPNALRVVVNHGLNRQRPLGDTVARLADLAAQDLSGDKEIVSRLLKALREELPLKILGFVIQKNTQDVLHLTEALSSTPAPEVRQAFEEIVHRFPDRVFARAASKALAGFDFAAPPAQAPEASLSGNLELFGLPNLLQNLAQSEVTGILSLKDQKGEIFCTLALEKGRLRSSQVGLLRGEDAFYQLLEKPLSGTFDFVRWPEAGSPTPPSSARPLELVPLLLEGMRRYDEFQRACALVPNTMVLKPTQTKPTPHPDERDMTLSRAVWMKASSGEAPAQCEEHVLTDSYRIRRLLAHWVEEGALAPN